MLAALAITGCGDPDTQQVHTQRTPLIYSGLNIGDGFNPSFPSLIPSSAADCFAEGVNTEALEGESRYYAFYAFSPDEARSKFIELARPQSQDITLPGTLHGLMSNVADGNTPYLILAIQIDTYRDVMSSSLEASLCSQFGDNLDEFVEHCGTQYLHDQIYGGYIFLAAPITSNTMDNEQYDEINNLINPYIQKHGKSAADAIADIAAVTSSHLCVLAGMQGKMAGGGEAARVGWVSGVWYLNSTSDQNAASNRMSVHAMCAQRKWFTTNGTGVTSWAPEIDTALSTGSGGNYDTPLNMGAYAAALSGVKGKMDSESEVAQVNVAGSAGAYTELQVIANNYFEGRAITFGVDHNASLLPLVPSPASKNADSNSTDPNSSDNWLDSYMHKVKLASTDDTFCYLTRIQGRFDGNGEGVRLITEGNYWYLQAKAGCEQRDSSGLWSGVYVCSDWKRVQATARCYRYNQN